MHLIDTHCHIDLYPDYRELIEEINRLQIATVAVTTTPSVFRRCMEITNGNRFIRTALGLHPELVAQRHRELDLMLELLGETRYIGEVGLDFVTTDADVRARQRKVFSAILEGCARSGDKILTVHSRRAAVEVVEMVGADFPGKVILHWYSGSRKVLETALANGLYFSINPAMMSGASGRKLVEAMPRNRVLTETDGPFVNVDGHPARPGDVERVVVELAQLWRCDVGEASQTLFDNFRAVVRAPQSQGEEFDTT